MSVPTITLSSFALALGTAQRLTMLESLPLHKAYVKAGPEIRAEMRVEFIGAYVCGALNVSAAKAAKLLEMKRGERTPDDEKAVNAAGQKFKYHVIRDAGLGKTEAADEVEVPAELIAAAAKLAKLAAQYENARSLASKALALAFATAA